jgi:hypothetical protein
MCLEDLRLGRMRYGQVTNVTGAGVRSVPAVAGNMKRVLLAFFSTPSTGTFYNLYYNTSYPGPYAFQLSNQFYYMELRIEDYGSMVTGAWDVLTIDTAILSIMEVFSDQATFLKDVQDKP